APLVSKATTPPAVRSSTTCENDSITARSSLTSDSFWVTRLTGSSATPVSMMRALSSSRSAIGPLLAPRPGMLAHDGTTPRAQGRVGGRFGNLRWHGRGVATTGGLAGGDEAAAAGRGPDRGRL